MVPTVARFSGSKSLALCPQCVDSKPNYPRVPPFRPRSKGAQKFAPLSETERREATLAAIGPSCMALRFATLSEVAAAHLEQADPLWRAPGRGE